MVKRKAVPASRPRSAIVTAVAVITLVNRGRDAEGRHDQEAD